MRTSWWALLVVGFSVVVGCAGEDGPIAPPRHLRAAFQPLPPPLLSLFARYGMVRMDLFWDPSASLAAEEDGRHVVYEVESGRLDLRTEKGAAAHDAETVALGVPLTRGVAAGLYGVVAEGPGGTQSDLGASGLIVPPRFLYGTELAPPGTEPDCLPPAPVRVLATDGQGGTWLGTHGAGLVFRSPDGGIRRWTTHRGLRADRVTAVLADGAGGAWVGTPGGLQHLAADGHWRTWAAPVRGPEGVVEGLARAADGTLWMAADGALWRLPVGADAPVPLGAPPSVDAPAALLSDMRTLAETEAWQAHAGALPGASGGVRDVSTAPDGALWVAGPGGGLLRQTPGTLAWRFFTPPEGVRAARVAPEAGGGAFAATETALFHVDPDGTWQPLVLPGALAGGGVTALVVPGPGGLAAVLHGQIVVCDAAALGCELAGTPADEARAPTSLAVEAAGAIWVGTADGRLVRRETPQDDGTPVPGRCEAVPPADDLTAVALAPDGAVWIASALAVARRDPWSGLWRVERRGERLPDAPVTALAFDRNGNLYAASVAGLAVRSADLGLWTAVPWGAEVAAVPIQALAPAADGTVWAGGPAGLRWHDLAHARAVDVTLPGEPGEGRVTGLVPALSGGAWAASSAGLLRVLHGRVSTPAGPGLDAPVSAIHMHGSGELWVALPDALARLHVLLGTSSRFPLPGGWRDDRVVALAVTPGGIVAAATRAGRIGCLPADGVFRELPVALSDAAPVEVRGMVVDPHGTAWIATTGLGLTAIPAICR